MSDSTFKIKSLTISLTWEGWYERMQELMQYETVDFYEIKNHLHLPKADTFLFDGNPEAQRAYFWLLFELHQHIRTLIFRDHERMRTNVHRTIGDTKFEDHELYKWQELYSLVHAKFVEQLEWILYVPEPFAQSPEFWQDDKKGLKLTLDVAEPIMQWYMGGRKRPDTVGVKLLLGDQGTKKKENKNILRFMIFLVNMALVNSKPYFDKASDFTSKDRQNQEDLRSLAHANMVPIMHWFVDAGKTEELTRLWCINRNILLALQQVLNERYLGRFSSLEEAFARQGGVIGAGSKDLSVYFTLQKHWEGQKSLVS